MRSRQKLQNTLLLPLMGELGLEANFTRGASSLAHAKGRNVQLDPMRTLTLWPNDPLKIRGKMLKIYTVSGWPADS